nr:hypothetical protein [Tanacetum cinerariifolium]
MGIYDFLCLPEWIGAEVQEDPHLDDLAVGTLSSKILANDEASQNVGAILLLLLKVLVPEGIMADDAVASFIAVSQPRPSSKPDPSFRDVSGDSIHKNFFPFSVGPYYATYPEGGVAAKYEFTREELNQSHHKYVLSADSRLKGYEEKVASLTGLELQVSTLKKRVSNLNDKLSYSDASFAKSKAKGELLSLAAGVGFERGLSMHQTKDEFAAVLKKMDPFMPGAQGRLAEADTRVSPPIAKDSIVAPASKSLEFFANVDPALFVVASEQNKEWGTSYVLDDLAEVTVVSSRRVSFGLTVVVVAFFASEKGYGSLPFVAADEEATANSSRV